MILLFRINSLVCNDNNDIVGFATVTLTLDRVFPSSFFFFSSLLILFFSINQILAEVTTNTVEGRIFIMDEHQQPVGSSTGTDIFLLLQSFVI